MRRAVAAISLLIAAGCATEHSADAPVAPQGQGAVLKSAELARVRCLVVAPFENGSDAPLAADAATGAVLSGIDPARTRVFPIPELRGIFRETPLDLPQGLPPSLALELAELLGADAALWGSVEGRAKDGGELLVTIRLSLVGDHQLVFADTALVPVGPVERSDTAVRRAVLQAVRPMLARLGDPGRKRCFDVERVRTLRKFAVQQAPEAKPPEKPAASATADPTSTPTPTSTSTSTPTSTSTSTATSTPTETPNRAATSASAASPAASTKHPAAARAEPRSPRQADWAQRLAAGGRVLVEDLAFAGRTAELQRDGGLADLAAALFAQPSVTVRIEGFVDATSDRAADAKLSAAMAQAAARRLAERGIPKHRVIAAGRGGESPILPNFTSRGRTANRRIEAVAVP